MKTNLLLDRISVWITHTRCALACVCHSNPYFEGPTAAHTLLNQFSFTHIENSFTRLSIPKWLVYTCGVWKRMRISMPCVPGNTWSHVPCTRSHVPWVQPMGTATKQNKGSLCVCVASQACTEQGNKPKGNSLWIQDLKQSSIQD